MAIPMAVLIRILTTILSLVRKFGRLFAIEVFCFEFTLFPHF